MSDSPDARTNKLAVQSDQSDQSTASLLHHTKTWVVQPVDSFPRKFGRYELRTLLGRGGMASVYLAHDPMLDRLVALKIPKPTLDDSASWHDRFLTEARLAATLSHPNICPIYEVGEFEAQPFLTMAYVEGESLARKAIRLAKFSTREAVVIVAKIARAMAEAHDRGIVHRDLKPANVMIDRRGEPIVMDFGLAHRAEGESDLRLTLSGLAVGTPAYMSPEQAGGELEAICPASDVWALGVILFQLVTGRVPFNAKSFGELIAQIVRDHPPAPSQTNPEIDGKLEAIIMKALEKSPSGRFRDGAEFAEVLEAYLRNEPLPDHLKRSPKDPRTPSSKTPVASPAARSPNHTRRWVATALVGALAPLILGTILYVSTDYGTLVVELSDPDANVEVLVNGDEVVLAPGENSVRIRAGSDQKLRVFGQGYETVSESFDLKRGATTVVQVTLRPPRMPADSELPPAGSEEKTSSTVASRGDSAPKAEQETRPLKPIAAPAKATLVEIPGWQMLVDARPEEIQTWVGERKNSGQSVHWVDAAMVGDQPVYSAIAALDERESDWLVLFDVPYEEMNDVRLLARRVDGSKFIVRSMAGTHNGKDLLSTILFVPGGIAGGALGLTPQGTVDSLFARLKEGGMELQLARPVTLNSRIFFEVAVIPAPGQGFLSSFEASESELNNSLETLRANHLRPLTVVPYVKRSKLVYAYTTNAKETRDPWEFRKGLTSAELQATALELSNQGFVPDFVAAYGWDDAVRYATIWIKDGNRARDEGDGKP